MTATSSVPGPDWPAIEAGEAGFDPALLAQAVAFAAARETSWPRSLYVEERYVGSINAGDRPPYDHPLGPVTPRGGPNGLILRAGRLVAEWGDTRRADMTFSVAKSYLAVLAGIALRRGLIASIDERVSERVQDGGFDGSHNGAITWRNLLEQTSEWHGTLFGLPDSVDWNRRMGPGTVADQGEKGSDRRLQTPGSHFEYNDVRVNRLSLSLLRLFGEPLPEVLDRAIASPLGCSGTWRWEGYRTSWVEVGGRPVQSVSGGGHWGGGMVVSARDQARLGELILAGGQWCGSDLLPRAWIEAMLTPSRANPNYGLLWWLNGDGRLYPTAPETSAFAIGGGSHLVWIDRPRDLVVVLRWLDKAAVDEVLGLITRACRE